MNRVRVDGGLYLFCYPIFTETYSGFDNTHNRFVSLLIAFPFFV
jgi:hypothetical protein